MCDYLLVYACVCVAIFAYQCNYTYRCMYVRTCTCVHSFQWSVYVYIVSTVYCFCFALKKFHGLMPFLSLPEKFLRLPVTLPILGTLDSNIHRKTFVVTKRSAKTVELFNTKQKQ